MELNNNERTTLGEKWMRKFMVVKSLRPHEKYILFSAQKSEKGIGWKLGRLLGIDEV